MYTRWYLSILIISSTLYASSSDDDFLMLPDIADDQITIDLENRTKQTFWVLDLSGVPREIPPEQTTELDISRNNWKTQDFVIWRSFNPNTPYPAFLTLTYKPEIAPGNLRITYKPFTGYALWYWHKRPHWQLLNVVKKKHKKQPPAQ